MTNDDHQPEGGVSAVDPVVAEALRTMPVPAATPEFWATLHERLTPSAQAGVDPAEAVSPVSLALVEQPVGDAQPVVDLAPVVPLAPRRRFRWPVAVGTAAAAALAFGVAVASGGGGGRDLTVAAPPTSQAAAPTTEASVAPTTAEPRATATTARATASTTSPRRTEPRSGQQAVTAFSAAVDRGDADAAWALLANRSRAYWETQERFAASLPELARGGYGSWSTTANRTATSIVTAASGDGEILIVTLRGAAPQGSAAPARVQAFPIRHVKGTFRLEIFDVGPGGTIPEVTGPGQVSDATVRTSDPRPALQVRTASDSVIWSVDARDPLLAVASGGRATLTPEQPLTKGIHVVTIASMGPDWLTATAVVVEVS